MGLFARQIEATPTAPAKRGRNSVTCGELDAAIAAVNAEMDTCTTRQTVEALWILTNGAADGDIVNLNGAPPVTCTELDAAIADLRGLGMPAGTLGPLKQIRARIAQAEEQEAKAAAVVVTRAEFDALINAVAIVVANIDAARDRQGFPDGRLSAQLQCVAASDSMLQRIMDLAQFACKKNGERERERKHARRLPGQPWST